MKLLLRSLWNLKKSRNLLKEDRKLTLSPLEPLQGPQEPTQYDPYTPEHLAISFYTPIETPQGPTEPAQEHLEHPCRTLLRNPGAPLLVRSLKPPQGPAETIQRHMGHPGSSQRTPRTSQGLLESAQ